MLTLLVVPQAAPMVQHQSETLRQRVSVSAGGDITAIRIKQGPLDHGLLQAWMDHLLATRGKELQRPDLQHESHALADLQAAAGKCTKLSHAGTQARSTRFPFSKCDRALSPPAFT